MTRMPPQPTRCVAYVDDDSGQFFMPGVEAWLTGRDRPTPQGSVAIPGARGRLQYRGLVGDQPATPGVAGRGARLAAVTQQHARCLSCCM